MLLKGRVEIGCSLTAKPRVRKRGNPFQHNDKKIEERENPVEILLIKQYEQ